MVAEQLNNKQISTVQRKRDYKKELGPKLKIKHHFKMNPHNVP